MNLYHWLGVIAIVLLLYNCQLASPTQVETINYSIDENRMGQDSVIIGIIAPYELQIKEEMEEIIGSANMELTLEKPESTLGNWMVDLLFDESKKYYDGAIDFAILNYGGVRLKSLPKGALKRGKIFELMPFDNFWVVVELDAAGVQQFLNLIAADGGWPISRHLRFKIKSNKAEGILIKEKGLDQGKIYNIAMPDFIANGGGHCDFLENKKRITTNQLVRNIIIDGIIERSNRSIKVKGTKDGRLTLNKD